MKEINVGDKVLYRKSKNKILSGVVVSLIKDTPDFHGIVEVWFKNITNYGNNNCEHFCYNNFQNFLCKINANTIKENSVGNIVNTIFGSAVIVNSLDGIISLFITQDDNHLLDFKLDKNFNSSTYCIEVSNSILNTYLI